MQNTDLVETVFHPQTKYTGKIDVKSLLIMVLPRNRNHEMEAESTKLGPPSMLEIRKVKSEDQNAIWKIFHEIVKTGDTYPYQPDTTKEEAIQIWIQSPAATYVAIHQGKIVGTYYIKPNQPDLGSHVCNCGYMVSHEARGLGIATKMCIHSQEEARELGFLAMQFNLVVSTNELAVRLWQKLGFEIIGTLPKVFQHQTLGLVDAHVMYKWLGK